MAKRKTVDSNEGPCPKRPASHGPGCGHLFQNPRNVPPWWCIYCGRLAIVPAPPPDADGPGDARKETDRG